MPGIQLLPMDREPYPQAPDAVWLHDQDYCEVLFVSARRHNANLQRAVELLIHAADETIAKADGSPYHAMMARIRGQMETADFRRYVAGRLGLY